MNQNAKKWVKALRSGKYKQTTNRLHDNTGYCCLGVACDLAIKSGMTLRKSTRAVDECEYGVHEITKYGNQEDILPVKVYKWLGLNSYTGDFGDGHSLAELNDNGKNFDSIADVIESEPEGLFV